MNINGNRKEFCCSLLFVVAAALNAAKRIKEFLILYKKNGNNLHNAASKKVSRYSFV